MARWTADNGMHWAVSKNIHTALPRLNTHNLEIPSALLFNFIRKCILSISVCSVSALKCVTPNIVECTEEQSEDTSCDLDARLEAREIAAWRLDPIHLATDPRPVQTKEDLSFSLGTLAHNSDQKGQCLNLRILPQA
jgi:hypothetical protein